MKIFPQDEVEKLNLLIKSTKQEEFNNLPQRFIMAITKLMTNIDKKISGVSYFNRK